MENKKTNQIIHSKIHFIRGQCVMLDSDLAELYQVETGALNRAVRRNLERFPPDFAFQVLESEWENLRCHIGILENTGRGQYSKYLPMAFTQEGIAMLSGILRSETAIKANIEIMRTFVRMKNSESENQARSLISIHMINYGTRSKFSD